MSPRMLGLSLAALLLLILPASALAAQKPEGRIVNGTDAAQGEYPAQGLLQIQLDPDPAFDSYCGGTLVGSRHFLTAAHCTTNDLGLELPASSFRVRLGNVDRSPTTPDDYNVVDNDTNTDFDPVSFQSDSAMLILDRPANYELMRVVEENEDALWAPGTIARIIGWGATSSGGLDSEFLLEADVPIIDDTRCASSYGSDFDPATMVCAADAPGTPPSSSHDTCQGDSGGPLLVPDGGFFATAGIVSWGIGCADPANPGVYSRIGDNPLSSWVHSRFPKADFELSHQPRAGEPVTLTSISKHPEDETGAPYFTNYDWDLDNDGQFDDASGASVQHSFPSAGEGVAGLEASKPGGDKASIYYAFDIGGPPVATTTTTPPPTPPIANPPATTSRRVAILANRRVVVRRGRFALRLNFTADAPSGTAVVEVFRGRRKIGTGKVRVRQNGSRQVRVKLNKRGRRMLRRDRDGRMRVRVRVRVGRTVLNTKRITIRRR